MTERYTIEPPPERQRELSRDRKLDRIIDLLTPSSEDAEKGDATEVTFEPETSQLPTDPTLESAEEESDEAGQGEGSENVEVPDQRGYRFPSAKRRAVIERG